MNQQTRLRSLIAKHCSDTKTVVQVRAAIGKKTLQVSISANGGRRNKRLAKFANAMKRFEKELRKKFPKRKVRIDIWASPRKKDSPQKVTKLPEGKNITIITEPTYLEPKKP